MNDHTLPSADDERYGTFALIRRLLAEQDARHEEWNGPTTCAHTRMLSRRLRFWCEQREIDSIRHGLVAGIVRMEAVRIVVFLDELPEVLRIADDLVEIYHGIESAAGSNK